MKVNDDMNKEAVIFNIQRYSLHDGGGIRTMVFFKGCPFRCPWCSNPESLSTDVQIMKRESICMCCSAPDCMSCKNTPDECPTGAIEKIGEKMNTERIISEIKKDVVFYESSGGGVTVSGGECLLQQDAVYELLEKCKNLGIETAIETTAAVTIKDMNKLCDYVDKFLIDFKIIDRKKSMEIIGLDTDILKKQFEEIISRGKKVIPRIPLIPGFTAEEKNINSIIEYLKPFCERSEIQEVHLLPFHQMGSGKYKSLGMEYYMEKNPEMSDEEAYIIEEKFRKNNIKTVLRGD